MNLRVIRATLRQPPQRSNQLQLWPCRQPSMEVTTIQAGCLLLPRWWYRSRWVRYPWSLIETDWGIHPRLSSRRSLPAKDATCQTASLCKNKQRWSDRRSTRRKQRLRVHCRFTLRRTRGFRAQCLNRNDYLGRWRRKSPYHISTTIARALSKLKLRSNSSRTKFRIFNGIARQRCQSTKSCSLRERVYQSLWGSIEATMAVTLIALLSLPSIGIEVGWVRGRTTGSEPASRVREKSVQS